MLDKKMKIKDYKENFESSLYLLSNLISTSARNLILVNINTSFVLNYIFSFLIQKNIHLMMPSTVDILKYGSLGGFLRFGLKKQEENTNNTLILDFSNKLSDLYNNIDELVEDINTNRDLFTQSYNSVIFFAPPPIAYSIMRYSADFWSCANYYFDTTKWFCSTVTIPIVKVRTFSNASLILSQRYLEDKERFLSYMHLKKQILETNVYSHDVFNKLLKQILSYNKGEIYFFDLMNNFIDVMTKNQSRGNTNEEKYNDLKSITFDDEFSLQLVDSQIMLAEYFYKCSKYEDAVLCYQKSIQTLAEKWQEFELKDTIITYLQCNIVVCRYMISQKHNPETLIACLNERFFKEDLSDEYVEFKNNYFSLVRFSTEHHSFAQHFDIFRVLEKMTVCSLPFLDISESYDVLFAWECFISNDFHPLYESKVNPLLDITNKMQQMIYHFMQGDYTKVRNLYKVAKYQSDIFDFVQLSDMIEVIMQNMKYLNEQPLIKQLVY